MHIKVNFTHMLGNCMYIKHACTILNDVSLVIQNLIYAKQNYFLLHINKKAKITNHKINLVIQKRVHGKDGPLDIPARLINMYILIFSDELFTSLLHS